MHPTRICAPAGHSRIVGPLRTPAALEGPRWIYVGRVVCVAGPVRSPGGDTGGCGCDAQGCLGPARANRSPTWPPGYSSPGILFLSFFLARLGVFRGRRRHATRSTCVADRGAPAPRRVLGSAGYQGAPGVRGREPCARAPRESVGELAAGKTIPIRPRGGDSPREPPLAGVSVGGEYPPSEGCMLQGGRGASDRRLTGSLQRTGSWGNMVRANGWSLGPGGTLHGRPETGPGSRDRLPLPGHIFL
jgi:hypothetical protein